MITSHFASWQTGVPPLLGQATPHAPQFATVSSEVSQPLAANASQSPHPDEQTREQTPAAHAAVPCGPEAQGAHGLEGSTGRSQPNAGSLRSTHVPEQFLVEPSQVKPHALETPPPPQDSGATHSPQSRT